MKILATLLVEKVGKLRHMYNVCNKGIVTCIPLVALEPPVGIAKSAGTLLEWRLDIKSSGRFADFQCDKNQGMRPRDYQGVFLWKFGNFHVIIDCFLGIHCPEIVYNSKGSSKRRDKTKIILLDKKPKVLIHVQELPKERSFPCGFVCSEMFAYISR